MTARWERNMDGGVEPIDEDLDRDLGLFRLAQELRVAPWELSDVDRRWVNVGMIRMEISRLQLEEQRRAENAARRKRKR